jgi:hypothetical protein
MNATIQRHNKDAVQCAKELTCVTFLFIKLVFGLKWELVCCAEKKQMPDHSATDVYMIIKYDQSKDKSV